MFEEGFVALGFFPSKFIVVVVVAMGVGVALFEAPVFKENGWSRAKLANEADFSFLLI